MNQSKTIASHHARHRHENGCRSTLAERIAILLLCALMLYPAEGVAAVQNVMEDPDRHIDANPLGKGYAATPAEWKGETIGPMPYVDAEIAIPVTPAGGDASFDTTDDDEMTVVTAKNYPYGLDGEITFNPDPTRAVWLSVLCPGLGQIYNRSYWKLPIVVGGFMGLGYATSWNNNQYTDYSQAYRDLLDSDPSTNSYMNFFPSTTHEEDLDQAWLQQVFKSRKDYFRRNRDLCIISLVAVYLICIVDAYVDASLMHFDVSPDLSLDLAPNVSLGGPDRRLNIGLAWALTF